MTTHSDAAFNRDWTVRPGATLKDWREENKLPLKAAATTCRLGPELYARIESGESQIDPLIASQLEVGTGIPARLWLRLERMYREDLAIGRKDFDA